MNRFSNTFSRSAKQFAAALAVTVASAASLTLASVGNASAQEINNWRNAYGEVWKNGTNELCWRNSFWTPQTAAAGCDGVPPPAPTVSVAAPAVESAPAPAVKPPPAPVVEPPAVEPAPAATVEPPPVPLSRVVLNADTFFDFDQSTLKPEGRQVLDQVVAQVNQLHELEGVIVVGHTDHIGTHAYNQALSERRAASVKAYLINQGIAAENIQTEGKGKTMPVASNATREGRARNRRVEIEIFGTRETRN